MTKPLAAVEHSATRTSHTMIFEHALTEDEVWSHLKIEGYFGYHPSGYGGWLTKVQREGHVDGSVWNYSHYSSCD